MTQQTPPLDGRDATSVLNTAVSLASGHVPGWSPTDGSLGWALLNAQARLAHVIGGRLDQVPDRVKAAFYDQLGLALLAPQAARAPVAFEPMTGTADSQVSGGTRVGATDPELDTPVVFESEAGAALATARLVEVVSAWPGRDAVSFHSAEAMRGDPFTPFSGLQQVEHALYVAHAEHFALTGASTVAVEIAVAQPSAKSLQLAWHYFDGERWRSLSTTHDGTSGLTKSGTVELSADCAVNVETRVHRTDGLWIRAVLDEQVSSSGGCGLPELADIRLRTVIDRTIDSCDALADDDPIQPDASYGGGQKLDLSNAIEPFGPRPAPGSVWYLQCDEALFRTNAEVSLCFTKVVTPEEELDDEAAQFEEQFTDMTAALFEAGLDVARAIAAAGEARAELATSTTEADALRDAVDTLEATVSDVAGRAGATVDLVWLDELVGPAEDVVTTANATAVGMVDPFSLGIELAILSALLSGNLSSVFSLVATLESHNDTRVQAAGSDNLTGVARSIEALRALEEVTPIGATVGAGAKLPTLSDPEVSWEYWNGRGWVELAIEGAPDALSLRDSGPIHFTVPRNLAMTEVEGSEGYWIRARLRHGGYGTVRIVSWRDEHSQKQNIMPIVEHRPPVLELVRFGYRWTSPDASPQHALTHNDFRFDDVTDATSGRGGQFAPFTAPPDRTPTLYLGFDRALPTDAIGLFFDVQEVLGLEAGPELIWEAYGDGEWHELSVSDETGHLVLPGLLSVAYPGFPAPVSADVVSAAEATVTVQTLEGAARFASGDEVFIAVGGEGELAVVDAVDQYEVRLREPLTEDHSSATMEIAGLARFGTPRTWLRARMREDGDPAASQVASIRTNVVWCEQRESVSDEIMGSGNGEADQVLWFRNVPVLDGQQVEVRELEGARAAVEEPMLRAELLAEGVSEDRIRLGTDIRTGDINAVWVRWEAVDNLLFAGSRDRVYTLERSTGRVLFGDGEHGAIPTAGSDNIMARSYRHGGGETGNFDVGEVNELLAGVLAQGVDNVRAADGGSGGGTFADIVERGGHTIRHRRQALTAQDYEDLAREASPAVAVARALPTRRADGTMAAGAVTVQIVPFSKDSQPQASFALRQMVQEYVRRRAPAAVAHGVAVVPATYLPVGVRVSVQPRSLSRAGEVVTLVSEEVHRFLHPLLGGADGLGWRFGEDVCLSDLAALLENIDGVDFIDSLQVSRNGAAAGEVLAVPEDRLVVAGTVNVSLSGGGS